MRIYNYTKVLLVLVCLMWTIIPAAGAKPIPRQSLNDKIDSLQSQLSLKLSCAERLDILHQACDLLYRQDLNYQKLLLFAEEGIQHAKKLKDVEKGSDLAVWILRANIYLRSYDKNPKYYSYLKELYTSNQISKDKYIQPLYSEIYSYIDYGKFKEAENKMQEFEQLIDKSEPKQLLYYLDIYIIFKKKAEEYLDASVALESFVTESKKIDDPRFEVIGLSRNCEFFMEDSINLENAKFYAQEALGVVKAKNVHQYKQHILLQLSKVFYRKNDIENFSKTFYQINADSISNDKILKKDYHFFAGDISFDRQEYEKAIKEYSKSIQLLENSDFNSMEQLTKRVEKCYIKLDDYKKAYKYAHRLNVLQDSLNTEENVKAIRVFESKLKSKDDETQRLKLENKIHAQKKSTIYIGFFSSLILLSLLFYNRILDEKVKVRTAALHHKNNELKSSLSELEQFSYIASHDIKEPMRVVSSVTGLIQKKLSKSEGQDTYAEEFSLVNNSINQLYNLIEDLSQFIDFKSAQVTHQLVDTTVLTSQIESMLGEQISEHNGRVSYDQLPEIYSSRSLLTVIFKNLIENGLKYNESETPTVQILYESTESNHIFKFRDNGIGINKKYHDYVFEMFKRLESRSKKGSGLGLGLVKKSIEKLGGSICIKDNQLGTGSVFVLTLPMNYSTNN